jgi:hypothetical protein
VVLLSGGPSCGRFGGRAAGAVFRGSAQLPRRAAELLWRPGALRSAAWAGGSAPACWWMTTYHHVSPERARRQHERHQREPKFLSSIPIADRLAVDRRSPALLRRRTSALSSADSMLRE